MTQDIPALPEFVLARIAGDEEDAQRLQAAYEADEVKASASVINARALVIPARVLAECEAKRQIMADHYHRKVARGCSCELHDDLMIFWECDSCIRVTPTYQDQGGWCLSVRALASVYADHPDYRPEWKP